MNTPVQMKASDARDAGDGHRERHMLRAEQRSLVRWLHDDLGQNLVAIKSFAAAIAEQHAGAGGDTVELADMIREAADSAYRRAYDLMQELRAQNGADSDLAGGIEKCLQEARLRENEIAYRYRIDPAVGELDSGTRALILRNLRCFVNFCKRQQACTQISVDLQLATGGNGRTLALILGHSGSYEHLDREDAGLQALEERLQAIGGEIQFAIDDNGEHFALNLYFDPLRVDFEPIS